VWILSASLNAGGTLYGQSLIPSRPTGANYQTLFTSENYPFIRWIGNSILVSLAASVFTVSFSALAAYAFSRFRFRGRRAGLLSILLIQMFPVMLAFVAIYLFLLWLGERIPPIGVNTLGGLILVYLGNALGLNTWLMKGYFDTVPHSLEDSAKIDGATQLQSFIRVIVPLSRPILAVVFILTFINTYSEYLIASILLSGSERFTLSVGLRLFIVGQYNTRWGTFCAAAILGAVPILALFLALQDQIISGLTGGAEKG
jgi:ABC-type maltose transport system permease subunit